MFHMYGRDSDVCDLQVNLCIAQGLHVADKTHGTPVGRLLMMFVGPLSSKYQLPSSATIDDADDHKLDDIPVFSYFVSMISFNYF